ncbi:hypothetical protein [Alteromonas australica]|uniref:hypothetical protein n=1 Tax=Alteromonas australica TaxID=589873 RepID=UPI00069495C3|nr:hypothetical protein [Alteromonas australica]
MSELTSTETKTILRITDCQLMHLRTLGKIAFEKRGGSFFYSLPNGHSALNHPLGNALLNWHKKKHDFPKTNEPIKQKSKLALERLLYEVLLPVNRSLGNPIITYGFTSFELKKHIQKSSPSGTAPTLDQHSSYEINSAGRQICSRGGAACDFYIEGLPTSNIVRFITQKLNYDRIYYYGNKRPLHVSIHLTDPLKHLQIMCESENGRRYPGKKAFGDQAIILAEGL